MMDAKIYSSEENRILVTEDYLIFDKDKAIQLSQLLMIKMNKEDKTAYCLLGQYEPGIFFCYLNSKPDDLIRDLEKQQVLSVVEKQAIDTPGRWGRYGELKFDDGYTLVWYTAQANKWLYFKLEDGAKTRIGYSYIQINLFNRDFTFEDERREVVNGLKSNESIHPYNPFDTEGLDAHFKSVEEFRESNPDYEITFNEKFGSKPANQFLVGCLTFIVIIFLSLIIAFIMA